MQTEPAFTPLQNFISDNSCFACGQENPFGLHMKFFSNERVVTSEVTIPFHMCGWGNLVHGGIISTLLDETMSWSAIHLLKRLILTRTMETEFIQPVPPNTLLRTEGASISASRTRRLWSPPFFIIRRRCVPGLPDGLPFSAQN